MRFTRDVDIVVLVTDDLEAEALTYQLRSAGYSAVATVEHETRHRLSTVRLLSPAGVKVDLLFASSGIEVEIVDSATPVDFEGAGSVPVAKAEELLAMKILSMTDTHLQDRIDAQRLLQFTIRVGERGDEQGVAAPTAPRWHVPCYAALTMTQWVALSQFAGSSGAKKRGGAGPKCDPGESHWFGEWHPVAQVGTGASRLAS